MDSSCRRQAGKGKITCRSEQEGEEEAGHDRERIGVALHARLCSVLLFAIGLADPHRPRQHDFGDPRAMRSP
jgi:hypothetical protein